MFSKLGCSWLLLGCSREMNPGCPAVTLSRCPAVGAVQLSGCPICAAVRAVHRNESGLSSCHAVTLSGLCSCHAVRAVKLSGLLMGDDSGLSSCHV